MTTSASDLSTTNKEILRRLRAGQRWLTEQHRLFLANDPRAASDKNFSNAMAGWDELERVFHCSDYRGCIWGAGYRCPEDAPLVCYGCIDKPVEAL